MNRYALRVLGALATVLVLIIGCGGSSEVADTPPGLVETGDASGTVELADISPDEFLVLLDGRSIPVPIGPDGSFEIPDVPVGEHVLDVLHRSGARGGRAEFRIDPDQRVVIPPIRVESVGQIVGLVTKLENRAYVPAAVVEVVARSDAIWLMGPTGQWSVAVDGSRPVSGTVTDPGDAAPLIFPPPPGFSYSAHTDDSGSYTVRGVKPGPYLVTVAVPGFRAVQRFVSVSPGRTSVADFLLVPVVQADLGKIEGTVTSLDSAGQSIPIKGAIIEVGIGIDWETPPPEPIPLPPELVAGVAEPAEGEDGEQFVMPTPIRWRVLKAITDERGRYELKVPAGARVVHAWAWRHAPQRREVVVPEGGTVRVDFGLESLPEPPPPPFPRPEPVG